MRAPTTASRLLVRRRPSAGLLAVPGIAVATIIGCGTVGTPPPAVAPAEVRALRLFVPDEVAVTEELERETLIALKQELLRAGVGVVADRQLPHDADVRLTLAMRSAGLVLEGTAALAVEREGRVIEQLVVGHDVYRRDRLASAVAVKLADQLARSPRLVALAHELGPAAPGGASPPPVPTPTSPPVAIPGPSAASPSPSEPAALGKAGLFGRGINVELLALGATQVVSAGGGEGGLTVATALQLDVGPRWAFRLPVALDFTTARSPGGFAALSITPGLVHRWRRRPDQVWVPYAGGGLKLGGFEAGRGLLDLPLVVMAALDLGEHHGTHSHDPNVEFRNRAAPELWAGIEYHASSWFSLDLGATYAWIRIAGENVHLFRQFLGVRFSF